MFHSSSLSYQHLQKVNRQQITISLFPIKIDPTSPTLVAHHIVKIDDITRTDIGKMFTIKFIHDGVTTIEP